MKDRWCLAPGAHPASRSWDGEVVVHHALSNDTHRVSEAAGCLIHELGAAGPHSVDTLARACGQPIGATLEILDALAELSLVTPC